MTKKRNPALMRKEDRPHAAVQIFCFTYAASSAQVFREWNAHVPEWIEVSGVELPGHGPRLKEPPLDSYDEAAVSLADTLEPLLDRPYAIFGHCLGAALGYEITRVFRSRGLPQPLHLFMTGLGGPHYGIPIADVESMDDDELIRHLSEEYQAPMDFLKNPDMRRIFLPMVRADARMTQNYRYIPGPPITCGVTAWAGDRDPYVTPERLDGWRRHTTASLTTRIQSGNHFFFLDAAPQVLAAFTDALAEKVAR